MKLTFSSDEVESQCRVLKDAKKLFDGNEALAKSLLARINALEQAPVIRDIIAQRQFNFHNLKNKNGRDLKGFFAIDVKTRRDPWRIILQPLDENELPYDPCSIDVISAEVRIVEIREVSNHYE